MRGVSVEVVLLYVVFSHVQTAVCISSDDQRRQVLKFIPLNDHRQHSNVTRGTKQRYRRDAPYNDKDVSGFSSEERQIIVNSHNQFRARERSSDMMYMTWDEDLAALAQAWSENCDFSHRPNNQRQNVGPHGYAGENLYASPGTYDPAGVMKAWYDEYKYYSYNTMACTHVCGHYTQVVWATSHAVGCGVKYCPVLRNVDFRRGFLVTCNYGPGGNYRGERPYKKGEACSACEEDAPFCALQTLCSKFPVIGSNGATSRSHPSQLLVGYIVMSAILSFRVVMSLLGPCSLL